LSQSFIVLGNLILMAVFVTYFNQVRRGLSVPNPSTWLLWTVVGVMNAASYFLVVHGNLWQSAYVLLSTVGLIVICVYAVVRGKFGRIGWTEIVCLALAVVVGVLWKATSDAVVANLSLQLIFIISFVPTVSGLLKRTLKEKALPWAMGVTSYICTVVGILTSVSFDLTALAYPVINGIVGNGTVLVVILLTGRRSEV